MSSSYGSIYIFIHFWYASQLFTPRIKLFKYIVRTKLKKATEKKKVSLAQTNKIYAKIQNHVHWMNAQNIAGRDKEHFYASFFHMYLYLSFHHEIVYLHVWGTYTSPIAKQKFHHIRAALF
jgi:hypothetical protein